MGNELREGNAKFREGKYLIPVLLQRKKQRETERQRDREKDRQKDRQTERQRETKTETETDKEKKNGDLIEITTRPLFRQSNKQRNLRPHQFDITNSVSSFCC